MTHAYSEIYLEDAMDSMGVMLDYVVYDQKINPDTFFKMFIDTGFARKIELGDPSVISGKSGIEIAWGVLEEAKYDEALFEPEPKTDRSDMYWVGWLLAYFQWHENISFKKIWESIPLYDIRKMYHPYHEADISKSVELLKKMLRKPEKIDIAKYRRFKGLTQAELAKKAHMSISQLQRLEYGERKTENLTLRSALSLANALGIDVEELID